MLIQRDVGYRGLSLYVSLKIIIYIYVIEYLDMSYLDRVFERFVEHVPEDIEEVVPQFLWFLLTLGLPRQGHTHPTDLMESGSV